MKPYKFETYFTIAMGIVWGDLLIEVTRLATDYLYTVLKGL